MKSMIQKRSLVFSREKDAEVVEEAPPVGEELAGAHEILGESVKALKIQWQCGHII